MNLISAGAAETVTGSCHLLSLRNKKILVDCGLFQGGQHLEDLNREAFPFDPSDVDVLLVTHGHLDHVGRLPKLVKEGFSGPIYATKTTRHIAEIVLLDAAKIQLEDYERELRKAQRAGKEKKVQKPLFDQQDVMQTLSLFQGVSMNKSLDLGDGISVIYKAAGHILGSGFLEIQSPEGTVIFSGDLGNTESGVQADFALPSACDAVLVETTYGNRKHRSMKETLSEFKSVILEALKSKGKILIPSFALERSQNILFHLKNLQQSGDLPKIPIFLDSPMASKMTQLYEGNENEFLPDVANQLKKGQNPFEPETLIYSITAEDSKKINEHQGKAIIIAGSGMMTGGRILHHLRHHLWKKETSLLIVGFQSEGTLGRLLVDGKKRVKIYGEEVAVKARIHTIGGFSAHADQDDLLRWLEPTGRANIFMIHGEVETMNTFGQTLSSHGRKVTMLRRNKPTDLKQNLGNFKSSEHTLGRESNTLNQ
jgi:metallo-beta-lactamase family protein